jgi:adenylate cyclase class 2
MSANNMEIEAKFYLSHFAPIQERLHELGARCVRERSSERNWRFDTRDGCLAAKGEILRLREDNGVHLTYKRRIDQPEVRREIEIEVEQVENTRALLEALGFEVTQVYEKYRQEFHWGVINIALDQLPFGDFVEIEGPSFADIQSAASQLHLEWDRRVDRTYLELFNHLKRERDLPFSDATFDLFSKIDPVMPEDLGIQDAYQELGSGERDA